LLILFPSIHIDYESIRINKRYL